MSSHGNGLQLPIPRLPVLSWQAWRGAAHADQPCILDLPNTLLTTSGRASILLALQAVGVEQGHVVLLPTYHCPTMVAPVAMLGATPRFYATDDQGGPRLEKLSPEDLRGVRAMLVAHFFGLPQPMEQLRAWCDARGIALIEDCAHAFFGATGGQPVGSWGDAAIGSLTKFLPVPEGGCLVLNRRQCAPRLTRCPLRDQLKAGLDIVEDGARHGRLAGLNRAVPAMTTAVRALLRKKGNAADLGSILDCIPADPIEAGLTIDLPLSNRRPTAATHLLARRLPRQPIATRRRANYRLLVSLLSDEQAFRPLLPALPEDAVPYVFPLWLHHPDPGYQALRAARVPVFRWDRPWKDVPAIEADAGRNWSHHVLQIACHQELEDADIHRIADSLRKQYVRPTTEWATPQLRGQQAPAPVNARVV